MRLTNFIRAVAFAAGAATAVVAQAADISGAYVSGRKTDDPALYRRIVITDGSDGEPTHLIHCPERLRLWIKMTLGPNQRVEMFDTLQAALNSIRRVLSDGRVL